MGQLRWWVNSCERQGSPIIDFAPTAREGFAPSPVAEGRVASVGPSGAASQRASLAALLAALHAGAEQCIDAGRLRGSGRNNFRQHLRLRRCPRAMASPLRGPIIRQGQPLTGLDAATSSDRSLDRSTQSIDHASWDWQGTFTPLVLRQIQTAADSARLYPHLPAVASGWALRSLFARRFVCECRTIPAIPALLDSAAGEGLAPADRRGSR
jgi:hypothetical protein